MLSVPSSFREMPRWWNDAAGRSWLDELPALVDIQCSKWELAIDGDPMHGSNALVVPVLRNGHEYALRVSPPGDPVAEEVRALNLWAGRGTVQLVDADEPARATLLERLQGTRTLASEPLDAAITVLGELTRTLAVPAPIGVTSTATIAADEAERFERAWRDLAGPTPRSQLQEAISLALERASEPVSGLAVNGDLHYQQVLAGIRAPWIVVDPVLLRGDAEYDIGRVLWSRMDEMPRDEDVFDAFDRFVTASGTPPDRASAWVVIRSMSYLLWGIPRGLTWDPPKCRRLLDLFC